MCRCLWRYINGKKIIEGMVEQSSGEEKMKNMLELKRIFVYK